jgi:predicted nucleic acid-binding protein
MTRFAIDAPALIRLVSQDRPVDARHQLVAPNAIRSRALDHLLRAVRAGELTEHQALELHERMTMQKMRLLGDRVSRREAWSIARGDGADAIADAEYVAVARLQADALITNDAYLVAMAAAQQVPVTSLDALFAGD